MRIGNKRIAKPILEILYTVQFIALIMGIASSLLGKILFFSWTGYLLLFILVSILLIFYSDGLFNYDSDGDTLTVTNKQFLYYQFIFKPETRLDVPKTKIIDYQIINYIVYRKLYIKIRSKKKGVLRMSFNITFLNFKNITDLKKSLNKIIETNKENDFT